MNFLKNIKWTPLNIFKAIGILAIFLVIITFLSNIGGMERLVSNNSRLSAGAGMSQGQTLAHTVSDGNYGMDDYAFEESAAKLSVRNITGPNPVVGETIGGDAEDFEVTDYNASIETRHKDNECSIIANLKDLDYVVFENANDYDQGCNYRFKVVAEKVPEVLAIIEGMDPKNLSENTYTIQKQLEDFTSQADILRAKLASIDETLTSAIAAYDEVTKLATNSKDAAALASIINNKVNIIERLTQERLNINAQLEKIERNKSQQLDKLNYTYFSVNVYENKYIDGELIRDSWKRSVQNFVYKINHLVQQLSIGLVALLLMAAKFVLYYFILLFAGKYIWKITKDIWNK